jgi:3-phosphoshikimate 1-carboxyvinyltransferase
MEEVLRLNGTDFDIRAAGTAMRFLTAFLSGKAGEWTLTGTERMKRRPVKPLVDALIALGARIEYMEREGFPPLRIFGRNLQGGAITLQGDVSSQYASALLMAAPLMREGLTLRLTGIVVSAPYIRLTIELMKRFGAAVKQQGQTIRVAPQAYRPVPFTVEADWSAASYWYAMAAISQRAGITLTGLFRDSLQGDAAGSKLFAHLGVDTVFTEQGIRLEPAPGNSCKRLEYNFVNEPDLAQTFAVTCAMKGIPFRFSGLQSLRIKETDRIAALKSELRKFGYRLTDSGKGVLEWTGERCEPESRPIIETYDDHRMAMAFAPCALARPEGITIAHPEVVAKSYPSFWKDLQTAGFDIREMPPSGCGCESFRLTYK